MGEEAVHSPYKMTQAILWGKLARSNQIPTLKITGQWGFKKDVIDKWISEEFLKMVTQNIKPLLKRKGKGK